MILCFSSLVMLKTEDYCKQLNRIQHFIISRTQVSDLDFEFEFIA